MLRQNIQDCRQMSKIKVLFSLKYKQIYGDIAIDIIIEF
jgi:hypothetical protein